MGLTNVRVANGLGEDKWGRAKINARDFTFDASYPTGGEVLSPESFGFKHLDGVEVIAYNAAAAPYEFKYDYATGKLMAYTGGSQVSNATDLSALTVRLVGISWGS